MTYRNDQKKKKRSEINKSVFSQIFHPGAEENDPKYSPSSKPFTMIAGGRGLIVLAIITVFWCEYLLPFIYIFDWDYDTELCVAGRSCSRFLVLSDPQLQGYQDEPWGPVGTVTRWDADRFIFRYFRWALERMKPDAVIILGDVLDEGSKATRHEHKLMNSRLLSLFETEIPTVVLPGDNDIGGEGKEALISERVMWFEKLHGNINKVMVLGGVEFVSVNTLGYGSILKGIGPNQQILTEMTKFLEDYEKNKTMSQNDHRAVILLSHIPLSDLRTSQRDDVLNAIKPLHVLSGHTHEYSKNEYRVGQLGTKEIYETVTPAISYRMGTPNIGFLSMVVSHGGDTESTDVVRVKLCQLAPRYPSLALYCIFLFICVIVFYAPAIGKRFPGLCRRPGKNRRHRDIS